MPLVNYPLAEAYLEKQGWSKVQPDLWRDPAMNEEVSLPEAENRLMRRMHPTPTLEQFCQRFPAVQMFRAWCRAAHACVDQRRKFTDEPYWIHPERVADLYLRVVGTGMDDFTLIVGVLTALGHDIEEDVAPLNSSFNLAAIQVQLLMFFDISPATLLRNAKIVTEVVFSIDALTKHFTKDAYPKLNRYTRLCMEAGRLWTLGTKSGSVIHDIKVCDIVDNTSDIPDPGFGAIYKKEKAVVLQALTEADPVLLEMANQQT